MIQEIGRTPERIGRLGPYAFSIDRLKIYLIGSKTGGEICLIISDEIPSYPELFLLSMFEKLHLTRHLLWVSPLRMSNHSVKRV